MLVDLDSGKKVSKFTAGHASSVSCMAFSPDGSTLATACIGGRFINIFDCTADHSAAGGIARTLTLETVPKSISLLSSASSGSDRMVTAVACGELGDVVFLKFPLAGGDNAAVSSVTFSQPGKSGGAPPTTSQPPPVPLGLLPLISPARPPLNDSEYRPDHYSTS